MCEATGLSSQFLWDTPTDRRIIPPPPFYRHSYGFLDTLPLGHICKRAIALACHLKSLLDVLVGLLYLKLFPAFPRGNCRRPSEIRQTMPSTRVINSTYYIFHNFSPKFIFECSQLSPRNHERDPMHFSGGLPMSDRLGRNQSDENVYKRHKVSLESTAGRKPSSKAHPTPQVTPLHFPCFSDPLCPGHLLH